MDQLTESNKPMTSLSEVQQSITVKSIQDRDYKALEIRKVQDALDRPTIAMIRKVLAPLQVEAFLVTSLIACTKSINIDPRLNLQPGQVQTIVELLLDQYPVETLEDIALCLRRGSVGYYGPIFRIDAAVINEWMQKYLDEKYQLIESGYRKEKKQEEKVTPPPPGLDKILSDFRMKIVNTNSWPTVDEIWKDGNTKMSDPEMIRQREEFAIRKQKKFEAAKKRGLHQVTDPKLLKSFRFGDEVVIARNEEEAKEIYNETK